MGQIRTVEDLIRHQMTVDGCKRLTVSLRHDGLFDVALVHRDGRTATCEGGADPADTLWNVLAPYAQRRWTPSGRMVLADPNVHALPTEVPLDDLLGDDSPAPVTPVSPPQEADLGDLLG